MKIMEEDLCACEERETFLEDELQRLRSELSARADLEKQNMDKIRGWLARARSIIQTQKEVLQFSESEISVLKSNNEDLKTQTNIALADLKKEEDRLTLKTEFMRWNVRRFTLELWKRSKQVLRTLMLLSSYEMEAKADKDMLPTPQLSPADIQAVAEPEFSLRGFRSCLISPTREGRWWWEDSNAKERGLHKGNIKDESMSGNGNGAVHADGSAAIANIFDPKDNAESRIY
ncbi:5'-adenylylsulfate reductase 2, chloroplastic [Capsicum baccatum]|uniref:5'-adenylylsulfate reductase 2, chloroplastic n=1 Tax=Capsicum baccatum TaxID=33114 RepID=A0A2G2WX22_CAPBA|nr:5'-adenylylsulfate reductase 2, chloroplastic [Capsicum baccatum]